MRDRVLVRFRDDPAPIHERIVVAVHRGDEVSVMTPDREVHRTSLSAGGRYAEVIPWAKHLQRLPAGYRQKDSYLAKHSALGRSEEAELTQAIVEHAAPAGERAPRRRLPLRGGAARAEAQADLAEVEREPGRERLALIDPPWQVALFILLEEGAGVGEVAEVLHGASTHKQGNQVVASWSRRGELVVALLVDMAEEEKMRAELKRRMHVGAPVRAGDGAEPDVRGLPVHFDHLDERWRTLEECVARYEEEEFADFPMSGPRTMARDIRQLRRLNSDFLKQHEEWARKSGVKPADRSVHGHASIARSLHFLVCYDQLQVCNLAGAECLNRRRARIESAHLGNPESPSYEGAGDYL